MKRTLTGVALALASIGCAQSADFGGDVAFLKQYTPVVMLSDAAGHAQVAVTPAWQGRVMTSTDGGAGGTSYGWVNRSLISTRKFVKHFNPLGGEDRFWMGPEGGQFSIFFAKGDTFDLDHWQTPAGFDTEPFTVVDKDTAHVRFEKKLALVNYSGTKFDVKVAREVRLLAAGDLWKRLGTAAAEGVSVVGYESVNRVTNAGTAAWNPKSGLLSIWILGMYNAAPDTTIVVPIKPGSEQQLGPRVNADYFGQVPPDRLVAREGVVYFRGDGRYRSKIGVTPERAKGVLASYDAKAHVLTIVQYTLPANATRYVNSQWKLQDNPYHGDVANSYSDDGKMGAFYELESSSPAAELAPGAMLEHVHRTIHLRGPEAALDRIASTTLGVSLDEIKRALPR